jgi:hypothetical protein
MRSQDPGMPLPIGVGSGRPIFDACREAARRDGAVVVPRGALELQPGIPLSGGLRLRSAVAFASRCARRDHLISADALSAGPGVVAPTMRRRRTDQPRTRNIQVAATFATAPGPA